MSISKRTVKNKRDTSGKLTGREGTVYDVNVKYTTLAGEQKAYTKKGFASRELAALHESQMYINLHNPEYVLTLTSQKQIGLQYQEPLIDCTYDTTTKAFLTSWLETVVKTSLRPTTYALYKSTINSQYIPMIGSLPVSKITPRIVDSCILQMRKSLTDSTIQVKLAVLKSALSLLEDSVLPKNPVRNISIKIRATHKLNPPYDIRHVAMLLTSARHTDIWANIVLAALIGLRLSETLGLRWRNVDFNSRQIIVQEQLPAGSTKQVKFLEHFPPTKSSPRTIAMTDFLYSTLQQIKQTQEKDKAQCREKGDIYYDNDLVAADKNGSIIPQNVLSRKFQKHLLKSGLPTTRFHDLRHAMATNVYLQTGDYFAVSHILGHSQSGRGTFAPMNMSAVTSRYIHATQSRDMVVLTSYHKAVLLAMNKVKQLGNNEK